MVSPLDGQVNNHAATSRMLQPDGIIAPTVGNARG